ncbi:xanthine dehydrogenase/oxidase [Folsomia candida]|uniref:xanthine dehydrogenase/oxidase n=1 Tax=Folsomia candida TaxID=158441 RepID=UPI000B9022E2|nr:xanthine dehydrogenase/oxidase [Folsomia candida]
MGAEQSQLSLNDNVKQNSVAFFINGKEYNVKTDVDKIGPNSLLVDFIRDKAGLTGTKYMCREGGCGACVVSVKSRDHTEIRAVNSCMTPVLSCDGWEITTVEGLGNKKDGYHPIQQQIVKFSASQCGFCTPGMVMNMYSLQQSKPTFKTQDVEDSFDGNLCRCTGYRPIMDAFKALASDASEELKRKAADGNSACNGCPMKINCCQNKDKDIEDIECCSGLSQIYVKLKSGEEWITATSLADVYTALQRFTEGGIKYRIVAGNTGTGVFKDDGPFAAFIDINSVPELKRSMIETSGVKIGANVTLCNAIDQLQKASEIDGYEYCAQMSKHLKRVANVPIRNAGTLSGNLMMKHAHREFPSDVFMLLESVGAKLLIGASPTVSKEYSMIEFRELDMRGKLILSIILPAYKGGNYYFKSYKITRRFQNAHAYVNGGILIKVDTKKNFNVSEKPRIVFGGISPDFVHSTQTENFLFGKDLNKGTLTSTMDTLEAELKPNETPTEGSQTYRKTLAQSLLYKTILSILGESAKASIKSGGQDLEHGPMSGKQTFESDQKEWPLYQPIPKLEAAVQASGEAEYVNDIHPEFGELYGAFVLTTVANATISNIDASEALMTPGVVNFIQAKDIPGPNNYAIFYPVVEEIFVKDKVRHAGQSVGLILAESRTTALEAAKKVKIVYSDVKKPLLDIKDSLKLAEKRGENCIFEIQKTPSDEDASANATQTIKGEFRVGSQYHMSMETQSCICIPKEDGMDVFCATQYSDMVQAIVSSTIQMPNHNINVTVRRLGGSYGAKISKSSHIAGACAVAAHVTNRPVRIVLDLETNMKMIGKRLPYLTTYEATVDDSGNIVGLKGSIFCDPGYAPNETTSLLAMICMQNCYRANGWQITPGRALTDTPSNTYCRAPGTTQGIASIEAIMEHISHVLKKDPGEVRATNFIKAGDPLLGVPGKTFEGENPISKMIVDLKTSSDYDARKKFVDNFNKTNRFRKRGLNLMPMRYPQHYPDFNVRFPVFISVYHVDGSVAVSHGGIEMGQGINTKCAQTVAKFLNIPLEKVRIKPTNSLVSPNAGVTGGAMGSELVCHSAMKACEILLKKMEPVRQEVKDPTWEKVVTACYNKHIMLTAQYEDKPGDDLKGYDIWAVCLTEVEVDVLTGEYKIVRVDLAEDAGLSLSPEVDIGQIEGAFVMGLELWTTEKLVYDKDTGEILTKNTWEYKPPFVKDIPEDFRITMIKNRPNPLGVLRSKATGEPPLCLSVSVIWALKNAIDSARKDAGNTDWYQINGPLTPEDIQRLSLTDKKQFDI